MKIYSIKNFLYIAAFRNQYDVLSKKIVNKIIDKIKNNAGGFLEQIDQYSLFVDISKINKKTNKFNDISFKVDAYVTASTKEIHIDITLNSDFGPKDYKKINYELYETIRHELEHINDFKMGKFPDDDYNKLYNEIMKSQNVLKDKEEMLSYMRLVSKYITSNEEIFSYVKSIMYVAKKQKRNIDDVILQVFNRAFFNNNRKNMLLVKDNLESKEIIEKTKNAIKNKVKDLYPNFKSVFI